MSHVVKTSVVTNSLGGVHVNVHRMFAAIIGAVAVSVSAAALTAQQGPSAPAAPGQASPEKPVTYVGCVATGATTDSYLLTNAKDKASKAKDAPRLNFKLEPTEKVKLERFVSRQVEVTGKISAAPATGAPGPAVPTFTVTNVKWQAELCD